MPQFKTMSELLSYVEKQHIVKILEKVAEEIKGVLRNNLMTNWYRSYSPTMYHRTGMLIDSIECKKAVKVGDSWQVEIWFNPDKIIAIPLTEKGYFPSHMNITDGSNDYNGQSYGELLPQWIENGQHSSIHSFIGIHMVEDTKDWAKADNYLKNRMKELLEDNGFKCM